MKNLSKPIKLLLFVVSLLSFNQSEAFYIGAGPIGFGVGRPYYGGYYNNYYDGGGYYSRPYGYYGGRYPRYHRVSRRFY